MTALFFHTSTARKDMIISGGFNVYPQTIEQAIYEAPAIQINASSFGVPDDYRGEAGKGLRDLAPRRLARL